MDDNSSGTSVATKYCYHTFHDPSFAPRPTVCGLVTRALLQKLSGSADHGAIPASHAAVQKFFEDNQPDLEGDLYYNKPGVWLAHMAEECEHKTVAFDVYENLYGPIGRE